MDRLSIILVLSVFLLLSCEARSSEKIASGNVQADIAKAGKSNGESCTLEITPKKPLRNSILTLISKGFKLSDTAVTWMVNGLPVAGVSGYQFRASDMEKGNVVQASAIVDGVAVISDPVEICSAPPEITSIKLMPETFKPGDDLLYVDATTSDPDEEPVSLFYEWTVNGQPAGTEQHLPVRPRRGDKISVKVTPFDGTNYGNPATLEKTIVNMPPVIDEHTESSFDGKTYTYQVRASDPDGDALTYTLESPQPGMTIDPSTGLLRWAVPPEFKGSQHVTINVSDGKGGNTKDGITIAIQ